MVELLDQGINPLVFPGLEVSVSSEESKAINFDATPKVIISASGMCDAGRIRHHLKHNLWRSSSIILFVGYQAKGTLGRNLIDGMESVKLFGEEIAVNAEIRTLAGKSGHADKNGLLAWIGAFQQKPHTVFVNHGEDESCKSFARCLKEEQGFQTVIAPYSGTVYDLAADAMVYEAQGVPVERKAPVEEGAAAEGKPRSAKPQQLYSALQEAAKRLTALARRFEGPPQQGRAAPHRGYQHPLR
jgi:metallo-beta-lactamase family protein